jgi:hypothetical protein
LKLENGGTNGLENNDRTGNFTFQELTRRAAYQARYFDPRTGTEHPLGEVRGDADGAWTLPSTPQMKDYVVVLEANN